MIFKNLEIVNIIYDTGWVGGVLGVRGSTNIWIKKTPTKRTDWPHKYEARMGIAILGVAHPGSDNPFDDFGRAVSEHDNQEVILAYKGRYTSQQAG